MSESTDVVNQFVEGDRLTHAAWKRALREGHLLGQVCGECGHATAAPKFACVRCGNRDLDIIDLPTTGSVYTETTIAVPPEVFEGRYSIALVDLGEARVMGRIDEDVEIGDAVELIGTVEADRNPGPLFR